MDKPNFRAWAETLALDLPELPTPDDIDDIANRVEKIAIAAYDAGREAMRIDMLSLEVSFSRNEYKESYDEGYCEACRNLFSAIRALPGKEG